MNSLFLRKSRMMSSEVSPSSMSVFEEPRFKRRLRRGELESTSAVLVLVLRERERLLVFVELSALSCWSRAGCDGMRRVVEVERDRADGIEEDTIRVALALEPK